MGERQPDVQRHQASLGAGAEQHQGQDQGSDLRRMGERADRGEAIAALDPGEQAEGEQQGEGAEARHDQIDIAGAGVVTDPVVGHHQRPGGQRHQLPGEQEGERIVGQHDQVHGGEEGWIERQHAPGRRLALAVAEAIEAGSRAAEVDHHQEEGGQGIEAELGPEPGQAERQGQPGRGLGAGDQMAEGGETGDRGGGQAETVDRLRHPWRAPAGHRQHGRAEQHGDRGQDQDHRHGVLARRARADTGAVGLQPPVRGDPRARGRGVRPQPRRPAGRAQHQRQPKLGVQRRPKGFN